MWRALSLGLLLSTACGHTARLIPGQSDASHHTGDERCGPVGIRRTALGSRWGEFFRVRVKTSATLVGQARLHVASRPVEPRTFFVGDGELVYDVRWANERLSVPSALEADAVIDLTLTDLRAAEGDCRALSFTVEQGPLVPEVSEAQWIAELERRGGPDVEAWRAAQRRQASDLRQVRAPPPPPKTRTPGAPITPSEEREWAAFRSQPDTDADTSEWRPWPLAARIAPPAEGTPLSKGAWVAWSSQPPLVRGVAQQLATELKLPLDSPAHLARLVERLRTELVTDEAVALALFVGLPRARLAALRAGPEATLTALGRQLPGPEREALAPAAMTLTYATAFALGWPLPPGTRVSSGFGPRQHPLLKETRMHTGVDLPVPEGTLIHAAGAGTVVRAGDDAVNGRFVIIDHGHGVTTAYLHNSKLLVMLGQHVNAAEPVSESGNTGRSTGPHLHYQLELDGQPVDPLYFRTGAALVSTREQPHPARHID
ncbi:MAG: M23 family metallopeptidase [Myxococcaceae bacterium]|nr:M23 family metallopeptidase [Myxococcaceae bacterium]